MLKVNRGWLVFLGVFFVFVTSAHADPFDDDFGRAQSQADDGFRELDKEIPNPEAPRPREKVIIIEKEVIRERLVPVPIPVPSPPPAPILRSPAPQAPTPPAPASERTVVSNGFRFNLVGCTLANRSIECQVTAVSEKEDKVILLYSNDDYYHQRKSSVFDNVGNQYAPRLTTLGNKEGESSIEGRLIKGIPTRIKLFFENVSSETTSISMLELQADENSKRFSVQFRNIAFGS